MPLSSNALSQHIRCMVSLRSLFVIVAVVAFAAFLPRFMTGGHIFQRRSIISLLADHSPIEEATFGAFDDGGIEEVVSTRFSLPNRPNTYLSLGNLEFHRNGKLKNIVIRQIGDLRFTIAAHDHRSSRDGIDVGPNTDFSGIIPAHFDNVTTIVDSYDSLYDYFSRWPTRGSAGQITLANGTTRLYYMNKDTNDSRRQMHKDALRGTAFTWRRLD